MGSELDFNKITNIDKYFYLKKGEHIFICQVIEINDKRVRFKFNGYYYLVNYYPYLSEPKLIFKNCNDEVHAGIMYSEILDEMYLGEFDDEILDEFEDAIKVFNDIIEQIEDDKAKRISTIKQLNTLDLKVTKCEVLNEKYLTEAINENNSIERYITVSKKLFEDMDNIAVLKSKSARTIKWLNFIKNKNV